MLRKFNLNEKIDYEGTVVYLITNTTNNKVYVGSAVTMKKRVDRPYRELNYGYHHNQHLLRSFQLNPDKFVVTVLEYVDYRGKIDDRYLLEREQYWIDYYESRNPDKGYNLKDNFDFNFLTKEQIEKREETHKKTYKAVMTFDKDTGEFIEEFENVTAAAKALGTSTSNVSGVCLGKHAYVKGRVCCYKSEYDPNKSYIAKKPNLKRSDETKERMRNAIVKWKGKKIYVFDDDLLVEVFNSTSECERAYKFKKDTLRYKRDTGIKYNGYLFYTEEKVKELDLLKDNN